MSKALPSTGISESEKSAYTEAEVHSKLFEPDLRVLGYPPRTNTQAAGEHFLEQRVLAMRRLASGKGRGHFDGLYMVGNAPLVLCEIKRYDAIDTPSAFNAAVKQLHDYALSEDFDRPPPFLLLYSGRPERTRFYRLKQMADGTLLDAASYEELPEIWRWERIRDAHVKGQFAEEVVDRKRLLEILLHHLDAVEADMRAPVSHAVEIVAAAKPPEMLTEFGQWLMDHPEAKRQVSLLYQRKVAEHPSNDRKRITEELVTQAALNHINKVFFLNLCEDRNLDGFYRIMREFLPTSRADTTATEAVVFLGLLRRKIRDTTGEWDREDERSYRELRGRLAPEIGASVIEQNNWWELIRVAFDIAGERFPLVYREDAFDYFRTETPTLADLVYDLSTKSFKGLTNRHVGDIYQGLLSSRREGEEGGRGGRRRQQSKLGAFYTPKGDVDYMISKLGLERDSKVLDPCMGSGHFLEGIYDALHGEYISAGFDPESAHAQVISEQLYGGDIDTFATGLAAIRIFLLDERGAQGARNLYVHDMLLHTPERPAAELFSGEALEARGATGAESVAAADLDPETDQPAPVDEISFDAVVGNPPYGAKTPAYKKGIYKQLYGTTKSDLAGGSRGTGDGDSYAMFFVSGIERLREGGRLCFITNDSFRSLTSHAPLRRLILDRCKIVEILLTDTKHFEGVSFQFAGMAITTLEKCSDPKARTEHEVRLVDYLRDPADFATPPSAKLTTIRQAEYEDLPETPFWVGVPRELFEAARGSGRVRDVARGRVGLQTGDDKKFLAGIEQPFSGLPHTIGRDQLASSVAMEHQRSGIPAGQPQWVPFSKGEGFGEYWRDPAVAIDWSAASVEELERRAGWKSGTPRKTYFRNRDYFFKAGLNYSVISSGRISVRLMPEGWAWSDKGSAIFAEPGTPELFLLGYLNSALATYFMKRIVNTTATAHIGYIEKLPYRRPDAELEQEVIAEVEEIVAALQADPKAETNARRERVDELIFDLFELSDASRRVVTDFYEGVGLVEPEAPAEE